MSAPTVVIGRFSATLHDTAPRPDGGPHPGATAGGSTADGLREPLRCVLDGGLERALTGVRLPPGHWCVRRLRLTVPLDLGRPGPAAGQDWSTALAAAIERTVREGRGEVVHYRDDVELLADLLAGVAAGRTERLWAWRQAGAVRPTDPAPTAEPLAAVLAALGRAPRHAAAALLRAAGACGLPALDRLLGAPGWQAVAGLAAVASWCAPGDGPSGDGTGGDAGAGTPPSAAARDLARTLLAGSALAALARSARLRPGPATLAAWAVLVAAEADPGSLHRRPHPGLPHALAAELRTLLGPAAPSSHGPAATPVPPPDTDPAKGVGPSPSTTRATVARPDHSPAPAAAPPAPAAAPAGAPGDGGPAPDRGSGAPTAWAGLLFLLASAADAGLPQRALDDGALTARPLRWILHRLGSDLLPEADPADPALLALAGLGPARAAALLAAPPPTPAERARLRTLATGWAAATAARLDPAAGPSADAPAGPSAGPSAGPPARPSADPSTAPDAAPADGRAAVRAIARRGGEVAAEPGWIEVRLAAADIDLTVRRAGLDLDPGWVPWLGAVVRYVYA
ncbi:hypothetical protein [Kitasatospora sp. NPDC048538]|uniref:hypothetical protein n=1 Tax=unclassified Kitasatospora TaxID=2633591 RepID=UPI00340089E7